MISYVIISLVSFFFFYISDQLNFRKKNVESCIIGLIGILIISIFAGLRNLNVGIDIATYGKGIFESVVRNGPKETLIVYSRWADIGYVYFDYLVSFFTSNLNVYLGILEFFIQFSFFCFFRKFNGISFPSLALLLLNLLTLALSMSMLRQMLAIAVVIWFFYFLIQKKYLLAIAWICFSMLFHKSVILIIAIEFSLFCYSMLKEKISQKLLLSIAISITFVLGYILYKFPMVIDIVIGDSTLSSIQTNKFGSPARLLVFLFPIVYFRLINKKKFIQSNFDYYLYLLCLMILIFSWLAGINYSMSRFANYLYPPYVLFLSIQVRKNDKRVDAIVIALWGVFAFWWLIVRGNEGGVIPYVPYWKDYISVLLL